MTCNAPAGARILGSLRSVDGMGIVRLEDRFDTDIDDLWSALTDPHRLAGWLGEVEGDLRPGGEFRAYVAGRERCDARTRWQELHPAYQDLAASLTQSDRGSIL
ncbi:MAG TPA: SRPBCC domain-containing protein [Actinomycetes bacterium]